MASSNVSDNDRDSPLLAAAARLRDSLKAANCRIVFAESCTCGRVAATLGEIAGISSWLCGSFVVYRNASKAGWLGIDASLLEDLSIGPVSPEASVALAKASLERTPEASISVAVTGDVGPGAPADTDGKIFVASAMRLGAGMKTRQAGHTLSCGYESGEAADVRRKRLLEATEFVLRWAAESLCC